MSSTCLRSASNLRPQATATATATVANKRKRTA